MKKRAGVPPMKGVSAFLSSPIAVPEHQTTSTLTIENITLPAKQPRRFFDPDKLDRLAKSIAQHGILEPLLVRPLPNGIYELVAGERRYRAAQMAGLSELPVIVKELSEQEAWQLALIENLQREDLNPVEETEGVLELLTLQLQCSREDILETLAKMATAQKKGTELSENVFRQGEAIASILNLTIGLTPESFRVSRVPLLKLPTDVLEVLSQGRLEYTKARLISQLKEDELRQALLEEAIANHLSLNQIKTRLRELSPSVPKEATASVRLASISQKLKQKKKLEDPKKQERLEKLLTELESLVDD